MTLTYTLTDDDGAPLAQQSIRVEDTTLLEVDRDVQQWLGSYRITTCYAAATGGGAPARAA